MDRVFSPSLSTLLMGALAISISQVAWPQDTTVDSDDVAAIKADLQRERNTLAQQRQALDRQEARLLELERKLNGSPSGIAERDRHAVAAQAGAIAPSPNQKSRVESVGQAPAEPTRPPPVAALGDQGGIITNRNRLTVEGDLEYARADRNRVIFRGIEVPQAVLVGVFDINESRQDVLTAALVSRYGLTNRLEANIRVPYVYRSDASVLSPVSASPDSEVGRRDYSVRATRLGDVEFGLRYQFTDGLNGKPFLIGGLQVLTPTGTNPYQVPRDAIGNATRAATGAGFWGISPSLTALLPSDPAVLFASVGYTYNVGRNINRMIGDSLIERVRPGGEPSLSFGIGLSLNPRTAISFAYAHTWSFGTDTRSRVLINGTTEATLSDPIESTSRDLQLGRLIFGVSYRVNEKTTVNWNVEVGATDDAADVRTTFRVPFGLSL